MILSHDLSFYSIPVYIMSVFGVLGIYNFDTATDTAPSHHHPLFTTQNARMSQWTETVAEQSRRAD